jgi:hypothetical protein
MCVYVCVRVCVRAVCALLMPCVHALRCPGRGLVMEKAGPATMMRYLDIVCAFIWQATLEHQPVRKWYGA